MTLIGIAIFSLDNIIIVWGVGSIIAGILSILSYIGVVKTPSIFYKFAYFVYGSKTVLGILLAFLLGIMWLSIIFIPVIWFIAWKMYGNQIFS